MRPLLMILFPLLIYGKILDMPVIYDPFKKAKKIIKKAQEPKMALGKRKQKVILLTALFNQKAFINGKFYKKGDKIYGYTLMNIKDNYIVLERNGKRKIIPLRKTKVIGKMKNE